MPMNFSRDEDSESLQDDAVQNMSSDAPITRLPPEILAAIFTILASIDQPSSPRRRHQHNADASDSPLGWLTVTHVCQHWRHVTLQDATLWADNIIAPFPLGDRWAAAFFLRANSALLTIRRPHVLPTSIPKPPTLSEFALIRQNLSRTRILSLRIPDTTPLPLWTPAPFLHTLELIFYQALVTSAYTIIPPFFSGDLLGGATAASSLRNLRLVQLRTGPWSSPLLAQLVSLEVTHSDRLVRGEELTEMLDMLSRMRALERLSLQLRFGNADMPHAVVSLPQLRTLDLLTSVASARILLTHLTLPAAARIRGELYWCAVYEVAALFPTVVSCVDARAAPFARIHIAPPALRKANVVAVTAWRSGDAAREPNLALSISYSQSNAARSRLLPAALGALASEHLEELTVHSYEQNPAWLEALRHAPKLQRVTVENDAVFSFCAALDGHARYLPKLSVLVIAGADFDRPCTAGDGTTHKLRDALPLCLAERARAGHALKDLDVKMCGLDEACAGKLQEAVPGMVVRWC
ncbi:hypothetical protein FA95DRAFT_170237 [Auriscalpium vulgare]|uniref:Uncharacterized protein n=1 Tax=Auriscalpium vulgare TaxID=40419 RepID=A0ACB8RMQ1_9AGAM|nr:hypothetical protein FA95DRAFT_170237 [Auriscalpium vulgare]